MKYYVLLLAELMFLLMFLLPFGLKGSSSKRQGLRLRGVVIFYVFFCHSNSQPRLHISHQIELCNFFKLWNFQRESLGCVCVCVLHSTGNLMHIQNQKLC